jgi:hypothetical protein
VQQQSFTDIVRLLMRPAGVLLGAGRWGAEQSQIDAWLRSVL